MKKVLFLGNSFTYFHDMPAMVQNLCNYDADRIHTVKLTYGGYHLAQYLEKDTEPNRRLEALLSGESWDFVVLHDQSSTPTVDPESFYAAAKILCEKIRAAGAKPVFYATWAYRNRLGKQAKLAAMNLTYEQFHAAQRSAYEKAAAENHADIVRVCDAFAEATAQGLYDELIRETDDYHPKIGGSYLAALMFAKYFFGEWQTPVWHPQPWELPLEISEKLQEIARKIPC